MKAISIAMVMLISAAASTCAASAEEKQAGKGSAGFEKIKALSGTWEVTPGPNAHGSPAGTVTYRVTAAGSAVLETLFGGTDHEMVTLYYLDGDKLTLTHYCMLQNRPCMRGQPQSSPDKLVFKCQEGDNAKIEAEDHMHQATFTFVDADHLKTKWALYKGGKPDSTHSFDLVRKKK